MKRAAIDLGPASAARRIAPARRAPAEGPRSPLRVMQIVELLAGAGSGLSLAAMTEALQIPKTSLLNHLRMLVAGGYASCVDGRYTLGPAGLRLGAVIAADAGVLAAAHPVEVELAAASGETAMVAMLDEPQAEAVCIDVVDGPQDVRYSPRIGSHWPLYCTGMGRALLAFQEPAVIRGYLEHAGLARRTDSSVTDPALLERVLDEIRATGVAVTAGEHTPGAGAVAAPVVERDGRVRHVVALGVPVDRLAQSRARLERLVADAARQVSWTLGGPGEPPPPSPATQPAATGARTDGRATTKKRPR